LVIGRVLLGACAAVFLVSGCFDVRLTDPGPFLLDDFDDGDFYPADPKFGPWQCSSYNQAGPSYGCDHVPGDDSLYALDLHATVVDPPDGLQQHGGAYVGTFATSPQDFTVFTEIGFQGKLEVDPIASSPRLNLEIACSTAAAEDGTVPGTLYVVTGIDIQAGWMSFNSTFTNFGPPPWIPTKIQGGTPGCLQRADAVRFSFDPGLPDGQTGGFTLTVDDITLE
jgi:hypothetical protein